MSKRTMGEWHVGAQNDQVFIIAGKPPSKSNDDPVHDSDRTPVAKVYRIEDAPLLAAAPELLDQLKKTNALLRTLIDAMPESYFEGRSADSKYVGSTLVANELAISKAEGKS